MQGVGCVTCDGECRGSHGVPFSVVQAVLCIVCGLPVVSQNFLENGRPCCRCVLAPPFWPSFQFIEYVKCILLALAAIPLQWT